MTEQHVAAIDQGTTGTRFIIFNHESELVNSYYEEHEQIFPRPGWVEHDPLEIWQKTEKVIKYTMEQQKLSFDDIKAIGITNQRETAVIWDRSSGKPVCNAIVWQDTRTAGICQELEKAGHSDFVRKRTGLVIATYFSGPKIKWILDNIPGTREKAAKGDLLFGNIDTWLIWNLTGGVNGGSHVTDVTNASRTMLMDLAKLEWDDEILELLNIPGSMLPEIRPSVDRNSYGKAVLKGVAGKNTPVCGDLGDQQAALFGQTCFDEGSAKNTYGTGCFLLLNTGRNIVESKSGLLTTVAYGMDKQATYALEGSIAITGAAVQWLRDQLGIINKASDIEELALKVNDNGGVYFVPAFVGLFSPYWDTTARGTIVGLTRGSSKAHLARAVLEAIAFQSLDAFQAMEKDSGIKLKSLRVDGGASKNDLLMQIQANLLNIECIRPKIEETTALGAAYAAGLATSYWDNIDELRGKWTVDKRYIPSIDETVRSNLIKNWKRAVDRAKGWLID
ncbi:MAG: glycerol kinase GlpK [Candidatus Hodarchaeales archaeon]